LVLEERANPGSVWNTGIFEFALRYPVSGGWKPLAWCGLAMVLSSAVLPVFAVLGYAHRVGRSAVYGGPEAPPFGNFFVRVFDGVMVTVVIGALGSLLLALTIFVLDTGRWLGLTDTELGGSLLVAFSFVLYVSNAFFTVHAATDSLTETFTTVRVPRFVASAYYLKSWLLQFLLVLSVFLIGAMTAVTVVGVVFLLPFALMVFGSYWGRVYKRAMDKGIVEPVETS